MTSKANEIRQYVERQDEGLIDLILSTPEPSEPKLKQTVYCPICKGDTISVTETAEGDSERCFFELHCLSCGCEFVLFEDNIDSCRRGIKNAKKDIEYNKNKIEYFKSKLGG